MRKLIESMRNRRATRWFSKNAVPLIKPQGIVDAAIVAGLKEQARHDLAQWMSRGEIEFSSTPLLFHSANEISVAYVIVTNRQFLWYVMGTVDAGGHIRRSTGALTLDSFVLGATERTPTGSSWQGEVLLLVAQVPGDTFVTLSEPPARAESEDVVSRADSLTLMFSQSRAAYRPDLVSTLFAGIERERAESGLPPFVRRASISGVSRED